MTSQFDFTNAEWSDVATLPVLVGFAVAMAEDSGRVGSYLEIRTLASRISAKAPDNAAKSLIEAVSTTDVRHKVEAFEDHSPELLGDVAVSAAEAITGMLDAKTGEEESHAYRKWVLDLGYEVAAAAKEHGVRISELETALLLRVKVALAL